jgi:rRNA maturation RNase YbeY
MAIHYFDHSVNSGLKQRRKLSAFLKTIIARHLPEKKTASLDYIFCTDDFLLEQNIRFLNHDTLTDIITFDLSETKTELLSEIYISVDRVKENASKFSVDYNQELHRVIFHGVLHLCGFKDKRPADQKLMREKEQECLRAYFNEA